MSLMTWMCEFTLKETNYKAGLENYYDWNQSAGDLEVK